ncbi:DUF4350 domain-containing protein [bacterium]|nr:DUF4350 domain-containing protein [bacterium]
MKKDSMIIIVLLAMLVIGGIFIANPQKREESKISTTYNADPMGVKAFHTLLNRAGYNADRLTRPYTELPDNTRLLIVVQPQNGKFSSSATASGISYKEQEYLAKWVSRGGVVIFLADDLNGVPASFGSTHRQGKGYIYAYPSRKMITNKGMRNSKNAVELIDIINKHTAKGNLILFDEYHHGVIDSKPLWSYISRQVWIAIWIIVFAGVLLIYSRGRRFGAVRNISTDENVRPGFEYVESVARLYRRSHASDMAAGILCDSFRQSLCAKLGVSADDKTDRIVFRLSEEVGSETVGRAEKLLTGLPAGESLTEEELVDIAVEVRRLEKELGIGN